MGNAEVNDVDENDADDSSLDALDNNILSPESKPDERLECNLDANYHVK